MPRKHIVKTAAGLILTGLCGCGKAGQAPAAERLGEHLYYLELPEYVFEAMPEGDSPLFSMGCSSVRSGNLYGRNLDLGYCDTPEFVVSLPHSEERFASMEDLRRSGCRILPMMESMKTE